MPASSYLILSTPRTGSTMLCSALEQVHGAGRPIEYLHPRVLARHGLSGRAGAETALQILSADAKRDGHALGIKLHFDQFMPLYVENGRITPEGDRLLQSFAVHILCTRRDKIMQALSFFHARRKNLWASRDAADEGRDDYAFSSELSPIITGIMHEFQMHESAWRATCQRLGIRPVEIVYEDLAADPGREVTRVLNTLGFLPASVPTPQTVKLSSPAALKAKALYLESIGA